MFLFFFVQPTHTSFYISFIGTITSSISKLTNLYYLSLNSNSLTGVIHYLLLHIITSNTILFIFIKPTHTFFHIAFVGTITSSISKLTNLYYLSLNSNSLTGVIHYLLLHIITSNTIMFLLLFVQPTHTYLFITFIGTIPYSIAKLTKLYYLWLNSNSLTGDILFLYIITYYDI